MPPTVSCASLLMITWIIFAGAVEPIIAIAPICIRAEPSPSIHHIFVSGSFSAIPRAIEDVCPIDPTVRKSYWCPCSFAVLISKSSLDAFPVVEIIGSFLEFFTISRITSSRSILLWFLYEIFVSVEIAPLLTTKATSFPTANFFLKHSICCSTSLSVVSLRITKASIPISSRSFKVISPW